MTNNKKPKKYMLGTVVLIKWSNDNGHSFNIEKRYKDDKDEWQSTQSLYRDDLLKLKTLIDKALESDIKEF